jgi:hypothetical protein
MAELLKYSSGHIIEFKGEESTLLMEDTQED